MTVSFGNMAGNTFAKKALVNSAVNDNAAHCYLFEGACGSGKKLLANSFVKLLFCRTKEDGCTCHSCVQFNSGNHSDLFYIRRGEKAKSIGIDIIRDRIISELGKKPFEYAHKVFIIEEAELLTVEAQNALLRSIEEPPEYAVFIFLCRYPSLLPTVVSRCFKYRMELFDHNTVCRHMASRGYDERMARIAGIYSGGSIGKAISLYESDAFHSLRAAVNELLSEDKHDLDMLFSRMRTLEEFKECADDLITAALIWLRDVLAYKSTGSKESVLQDDQILKITEAANVLSFRSVYLCVESIMEFKRNISANTLFGASLDSMAVKIYKSVQTIRNQENAND